MSSRPNLWICIYLHQLPLEVFTRATEQQDQPLVITDKQKVFSLNEAAATLGIKVGNSMDTAYTLSDRVISIERDQDKEQTKLRDLADWAYGFTPNVAVIEPWALLLDITGCLKLFKGLANLEKQILSGLIEQGYDAIVSISKTPLATLLIAQSHASQNTLPPLMAQASTADQVYLARAINHIAVRQMNVDKKIITGLEQMGIQNMRALLSLPRAGLSRRFGADFTNYLLRLIGKRADPQVFIRPADKFHRDITFLADVTNLNALTFPINRLLGDLCNYLDQRQLQIDSFTWQLSHRSHETLSFDIYLARPENTSKVFLALTQLKMAQITSVKELDTITLTVNQFYPIKAEFRDLFQKQAQGQQNIDQLLNMFHARLGPGLCFGLSEANDHRPEKAWQTIGPQQVDTQQRLQHTQGKPRPHFLLARPEALQLYKGLPYLRGKLVLLKGPERIDYGWWDHTIDKPLTRDYYVAKNLQGCCYWIFEHLDSQRWYLHGIFA